MRQDELLEQVISAIEREYMNPKIAKRLRAELERSVKESSNATSVSRLQNRIESVDQKLTKAERRLALVEDDMVDAVQSTIRDLRGQQSMLQSQLDTVNLPQLQRQDQDDRIDAAMTLFGRLRETLQSSNVVQLREFLHEAIERVKVFVGHEQHGKRKRYYLEGGEITLNSNNLYARTTVMNRLSRYTQERENAA